MQFNGEYFQQNFGIIMGTNVACILANLYLAMLKQEFETIYKMNNVKCPTFIGIFLGTKTCIASTEYLVFEPFKIQPKRSFLISLSHKNI